MWERKKNNGKKRENREKGKNKTTDEEKNVTPIKRQMSEKMIVTKYEKNDGQRFMLPL